MSWCRRRVQAGGRRGSRQSGRRTGDPVTAVEKSRMRSWLPGGFPMNMLLQHLLGHGRGRRVADEVGAELPGSRWFRTPCCRAGSGAGFRRAPSIVLSATCESLGLSRIGELDVRELLASDHQLLVLDAERVPGVEVVQVLLDDDVARSGELWILVTDGDRAGCRGPPSGSRSRPRTRAVRGRRST